EAILQLANLIDTKLLSRMGDNKINIRIVIGGKEMSEAAFFSSICPDDRDWVVPALRLLIHRYVDANSKSPRTYFQPDNPDDSVLAQAVLRLAEIDRESLPLVRAFGQQIDGGHEYFFAQKTVPAVIAAHGWTADVIEFVFWVLIFNFYNSFDRVSTVWCDLGLYAAIQSSPYEQVAALVFAKFGPSVARGELTWNTMAVLRRELGDAASSWEKGFFAELERLAPGSTIDNPDV
ncbi:MAG: hypothetical protein ACRCZF_13955, partial [Gemmataceae bacterium]